MHVGLEDPDTMQVIWGGSWDEFMKGSSNDTCSTSFDGSPIAICYCVFFQDPVDATACSSRTPSLAKTSAVFSVPSASPSVSSSFSTPVGRLPPVRPRNERRVQVSSGPQSGVHAAEVRLQQSSLRKLDELRVRTPACYEVPPLLFTHSQEGEIRGLELDLGGR